VVHPVVVEEPTAHSSWHSQRHCRPCGLRGRALQDEADSFQVREAYRQAFPQAHLVGREQQVLEEQGVGALDIAADLLVVAALAEYERSQ